ncbi:hypothetical protein P175DRAFT_0498951 [Aspergillus ochraceoroseus IBT 24754]|uniref:Zn(2)-C6 fungal-type domain-containing protein n=3 Tax=Aspergillus subgen. Nidulantes TaxID=2720870 RepID=A0A0F8WFZ8_9EURO|nr:uncharacterized protein P175DRAFT_0498951 [Aspergillus ochraceoroseus IBT 24754]KKK16725.1 hypothetical protein ARAM_004184 [Aspergillus rambellii]KKK17767.1 hypothetical protein AOCH_006112 [Aspergillus ochraceoroseus]PTU22414.1 hypothetical protein P175DRAFT_0498951 [Aspergillus ochraceoroseus IBT 24754]
MQYEASQWSQPHPASTDKLTPPSASAAACETAPSQLQPVKRHAACDECRKRKLKCSGELSGCSRCTKQSLICHYSVQKQMGRPPKKRMREDDDNVVFMGLSNSDMWTSSDNNQFSSDLGTETTVDSTQLFSPMYPTPFSNFPCRLSTDENHRHSLQLALGEPLSSVPSTASPWPDFHSVSSAAPNPFLLPPGLTPPISPSDSGASADTQCSCLSYLYLCLSHLSSLKSFPISQHTICSLSISSRTAQAIIRCPNCPSRFDTGFQNVMFTGTLLNVIADSWLRVSKADPVELGKQVSSPDCIAAINQSADPTAAWKDWLRQLVRNSVVHGPIDPGIKPPCLNSPSVLSLIEEMEARQRRWHESSDSHPLPPEQRLHSSPNLDVDPHAEQDLLCLRVAKSARHVIAKFEFEPDEYPDNVYLSPDGVSA